MNQSPQHPLGPLSHPSLRTPRSEQHQQHGIARRYLPIRKNACIVCSVCFTCSKYYGTDCICEEVQPRRGKNLPQGSLDSRAKKLHPQDKEDYEFSMNWLTDHANDIYKDHTGTVVGLRDLSEVSLCKAHSSTLYRAKKRHERSKNQAPPSPADSNGMDTIMADRTYADPYPLHPHPHHKAHAPPPLYPLSIGEGGLAAKVREITYQQQYRSPPIHDHSPPDFSMLSSSTSLKRKRTSRQFSPLNVQKPHSSASTPLLATGMAPRLSHPPPSSSSSAVSPTTARHVDNSYHFNQLPPLHTRTPSLSSLSSSLQQQLQLSSPFPPMYRSQQQQQQQQQSSCSSTSPQQEQRDPMSASPPAPTAPLPSKSQEIVLESVSLKSIPSPDAPPMYYIRNLAITDTFTFRDLLKEIDMTGPPPPGKRIVVSNEKNDLQYPLDEPIRNAVPRPSSTHMEFCIGLSDKPSIDWSTYV